MERLEVSCAVRLINKSLGAKGLKAKLKDGIGQTCRSKQCKQVKA